MQFRIVVKKIFALNFKPQDVILDNKYLLDAIIMY